MYYCLLDKVLIIANTKSFGYFTSVQSLEATLIDIALLLAEIFLVLYL